MQKIECDMIKFDSLLRTWIDFRGNINWEESYDKIRYVQYVITKAGGKIYRSNAKGAKSIIKCDDLYDKYYYHHKSKIKEVYHIDRVYEYLRAKYGEISLDLDLKKAKNKLKTISRDKLHSLNEFIDSKYEFMQNESKKTGDGIKETNFGLTMYRLKKEYYCVIYFLLAVNKKVESPLSYVYLRRIFNKYGLLYDELSVLISFFENVTYRSIHYFDLENRMRDIIEN